MIELFQLFVIAGPIVTLIWGLATWDDSHLWGEPL